jgi:predicted ATPase
LLEAGPWKPPRPSAHPGEHCAEALAELVDHSLVVFGTDAEHRRYSMHETIRQFAQEQLRGSDQEADALERHARYYAQLVSQAAENRAGQTLPERLRTVQDDHDNLRRAFEWLLAHDREQALALVAQLGTDLNFWELGGFFQEGRRWLQRALGAPRGRFRSSGHKPCWPQPSCPRRSPISSMGCGVLGKRSSCFSNLAISGGR